jgi:hypothetical protein
MFNNTGSDLSYAHTEHLFLNNFIKKYENNADALLGGSPYVVANSVHMTNYMKFAAARQLTWQKTVYCVLAKRRVTLRPTVGYAFSLQNMTIH